MSLTTKLASEKNQRALTELVTKAGNDICADCKARNPRWASHNLGIFICMNCASIHRKIGTHITKVKSLTMDVWTKDQVDVMREMGNVKSNAIYNANELRHPPPPNLEDGERDSEMEQYIRAKYEYRKFIDKKALVASKLGPSRSTTTVTPRSASSPQVASSSRASTLPPSSSSNNVKSPLGDRSISQSQSTTLAATPSIQPRSVSQPVVAPQNPPQQSNTAASGSVWNDLIQLQDPGSASSLPLQYQQPPAAPPQFLGLASLPTALSQPSFTTTPSIASNPTGFNPYQQQPQQQFQSQFQQQQLPTTPSFTSSPFTPSFTTFNQTMHQPQSSFGQQLFMQQTGVMATPPPQQAQFFQPQPQSGNSLQAPQTHSQLGFLTPSPSQGMMSAPVTQTHFMTPSPNQQFMSNTPQPQMSMQQPNQMFMTPSPQPMGMMNNGIQSHSPQPGMMGNQFMSQPMQQQQQQQQQQGQFLQGLPSQMLSPANFQASMNTQQGFGRNPFAQHSATM